MVNKKLHMYHWDCATSNGGRQSKFHCPIHGPNEQCLKGVRLILQLGSNDILKNPTFNENRGRPKPKLGLNMYTSLKESSKMSHNQKTVRPFDPNFSLVFLCLTTRKRQGLSIPFFLSSFCVSPPENVKAPQSQLFSSFLCLTTRSIRSNEESTSTKIRRP